MFNNLLQKIAGFLFNGRKVGLHEEARTHWHWRLEVFNADGSLDQCIERDNLIPDVAGNAYAQQAAGINTQNIGQSQYCALGTNATAPSYGDVQLGTETIRKPISINTVSGRTATLKTFYSQTEVVGTFREVGLFGNGATTVASITANSGILFSKIAVNFTIAATQTLIITITYTFTS